MNDKEICKLNKKTCLGYKDGYCISIENCLGKEDDIQEKQIFDKYGNYDFPTDIKQKGLNTASTQIEEMAKEIWRSEILCNTCGESTYTYCGEAIAELLYNAGYRKIPENAVVLTKEEYDELINLQRTHAEDLTNAIQSYEESKAELKIEYNNHIKNLEKTIDRQSKDLNSQADRLIDLKAKLEQTRKETAREILAEIENSMRNFEDDDDGYLLKKCEFMFFMRELAKEYDVEVE